MRLRGPAEAASQAALTGLAAAFGKVPGEAKMPSQMEHPRTPMGRQWRLGGGSGGEVTLQILAPCPQI